MSNKRIAVTPLAVKLADARLKRAAEVAAARSRIHVVHDAEDELPIFELTSDMAEAALPPAVVVSIFESAPGPSFFRRLATRCNKTFAAAFILVSFCGIGIGGYTAGWNDRIMTDARAAVASIMAEGLEPIITDSGKFRRDNLK